VDGKSHVFSSALAKEGSPTPKHMHATSSSERINVWFIVIT
jgi:hypothetical protein